MIKPIALLAVILMVQACQSTEQIYHERGARSIFIDRYSGVENQPLDISRFAYIKTRDLVIVDIKASEEDDWIRLSENRLQELPPGEYQLRIESTWALAGKKEGVGLTTWRPAVAHLSANLDSGKHYDVGPWFVATAQRKSNLLKYRVHLWNWRGRFAFDPENPQSFTDRKNTQAFKDELSGTPGLEAIRIQVAEKLICNPCRVSPR